MFAENVCILSLFVFQMYMNVLLLPVCLIAYVLLLSVSLITYLLLPLSEYELFCVSDVHECALAPCLNGAVCRELLGDYECTCPPGYSGKNCGIGELMLP